MSMMLSENTRTWGGIIHGINWVVGKHGPYMMLIQQKKML